MGGTAVADAGGVPAETLVKTIRGQRDAIVGMLAAALDKLIEETEKLSTAPQSLRVSLKFGEVNGNESTTLEFDINPMTFNDAIVEATPAPEATETVQVAAPDLPTLPNLEAAATAV